jgi:hypothetical protein
MHTAEERKRSEGFGRNEAKEQDFVSLGKNLQKLITLMLSFPALILKW